MRGRVVVVVVAARNGDLKKIESPSRVFSITTYEITGCFIYTSAIVRFFARSFAVCLLATFEERRYGVRKLMIVSSREKDVQSDFNHFEFFFFILCF